MRKIKENLGVIKKLLALFGSLLFVLVFAVLFGALGNILGTALTTYGAYGITQVLSNVNLNFFYFGGILFGIAVLRSILRYLEQLFNHYVAFKTLHIIRDKVFKALRRLSPAKLDGKNKGELISLITTDIELLEVFYAHTISPVLIAIIHSTVLFLFLQGIHASFAWLMLAFHFVMSIMIPWVSSKNTREIGKNQREQLSALNSVVLDTFAGIKECIQYEYGDVRLQLIDEKTESLNKSIKKLSKISAGNLSLSIFVVLLSSICTLLLSACLLQQNSITMRQAIVSLTLIMSSFGPSSALANLVNNLIITFSCGRRVLALLEEEPLLADITEKSDVEFSSLKVKNLGFSYDEGKLIEDVNFSVSKGDILGIEGKSGAGKSTLLKLLMRFYKPDQGSIEINETNIEDINTASLRSNQSYVSQSTYLFMGTVLDNIRIAKHNANLEEVIEACKKASIHGFIEKLPDGYETSIDSLVNVLSTGETQRIALARAFLSNAPLMLLDEPTSNIDSLNEGIVLQSLYQQSSDKALLLVSHRKSTLRIANKKLDILRDSFS